MKVIICYMLSGRYRTKMIGTLHSWKGGEIHFYDEAKRFYCLNPENLVWIKPVTNPRPQKEQEAKLDQMSIYEFIE